MVSTCFRDKNHYTKTPPYAVAYLALILLRFLGSGECLRLPFMFHRDRKWRVSLVKKIWQGESLVIFDHDNQIAYHIHGAGN